MPKVDKLSPGAVKLLQEKQHAHVVTLMPDGSPQVTVTWVDVEPDGSYLLINTSEGRVKLNNMIRDPRVAVSVVDVENPHRFAIIRGVMVEQRNEQEGAAAHIDKLAKKYTGADKYNRRHAEQRVMVRIKPQHVLERGT